MSKVKTTWTYVLCHANQLICVHCYQDTCTRRCGRMGPNEASRLEFVRVSFPIIEHLCKITIIAHKQKKLLLQPK